MPITKVEGKNRNHRVFLYTLSTCGWCKKTKQFLNDNGVEYEYLDVDTAGKEEREGAIKELRASKASLGFPIIVVDGERRIVGYRVDELREALGL
jgi:glutaredoxin-like protein NrdH